MPRRRDPRWVLLIALTGTALLAGFVLWVVGVKDRTSQEPVYTPTPVVAPATSGS
jgi:ABC-type transporter Mla subunit MlaD